MSVKNSNQRLHYYFSKKNSESLQIFYFLFTLVQVQVRSQSELNEQGSSSANVSPDAGDIDYITACIRNLKLN